MIINDRAVLVYVLPSNLTARAYESGQEMAWARDDALAVVSLLENAGYVIVGVDVWLATSPGPTIPAPYVYDWDIERADKRSNSASRFIKNFAWEQKDETHLSMTPFFVLTFIRNQ